LERLLWGRSRALRSSLRLVINTRRACCIKAGLQPERKRLRQLNRPGALEQLFASWPTGPLLARGDSSRWLSRSEAVCRQPLGPGGQHRDKQLGGWIWLPRKPSGPEPSSCVASRWMAAAAVSACVRCSIPAPRKRRARRPFRASVPSSGLFSHGTGRQPAAGNVLRGAGDRSRSGAIPGLEPGRDSLVSGQASRLGLGSYAFTAVGASNRAE